MFSRDFFSTAYFGTDYFRGDGDGGGSGPPPAPLPPSSGDDLLPHRKRHRRYEL